MATESGRKGYVVAVDYVTDMEPFLNDYLPVAAETIEDHGGDVLAGTFEFEELEGEWGHSNVFVLEFPSLESAEEWYNDEAYQEVIPVRHDTCEYTNIILTPEFASEDLA